MRKQTLFNNDWLFTDKKLDLDASDREFSAINLPHSNKYFNHHNIDNSDYQFISSYRKNFDLQKPTDGSLVFLEFDGVMMACEVYLNGILVGSHLGGFMSFSVNLTEHLKDSQNTLMVYVDSRERKDIPPYGHLVDYLTFGGIYRDVWLKIVHPIHIENIFVKPKDVLTKPFLESIIHLSRYQTGLVVNAVLLDEKDNQVREIHTSVQDKKITLVFDALTIIQLWDLDNPQLYRLDVTLTLDESEIDRSSARFGFREAEFRKDGGFYLNGNRIQIFGLNRHQTYPYIGAAAPARLQQQDAEILKYELACNVVRTSHYPQSPHFLNRCDEIGLLVFEEIAGWQHIGDEKWQNIVLDELQGMIERDRNHPSIILWGVRINESPDHDEFYVRTNALAHALDPTRQTGGARCFLGSSFLEDVYTYNDFSNTVIDPTQQPYLITEFAGHMFPTKIWDGEDRLIEHALLHTKIHNLQKGNTRISGAIGWCAFDYATHIEFGSGDRICYHGVMDTFRLPKWAGYFYQSQISPSKKVVLQAATHWTMGDRSGSGINPLTIFTNCDEVEVLIGDINVGKFCPEKTTYPNLAHPPIIIYGLNEYSAWGQRVFYDLHLIGYIDGHQVAEQRISSDKLPKKLEIKSSTDQLMADGSDIARVAFTITDEFGNPLPYARNIITFKLEGEADLIGENPFPMIGGQAAIYVRARRKSSLITITAQTPGLSEVKVFLKIMSQ
ncbi:MAG: glycoside hydrolase family 2 TIM barrel-domain containing protein [Anaerolineaceae bacterium]|nr:glycoside hydrolase family 2 TIM barrel-domain containing protein [Anaerolineaceae bacterium]